MKTNQLQVDNTTELLSQVELNQLSGGKYGLPMPSPFPLPYPFPTPYPLPFPKPMPLPEPILIN